MNDDSSQRLFAALSQQRPITWEDYLPNDSYEHVIQYYACEDVFRPTWNEDYWDYVFSLPALQQVRLMHSEHQLAIYTTPEPFEFTIYFPRRELQTRILPGPVPRFAPWQVDEFIHYPHRNFPHVSADEVSRAVTHDRPLLERSYKLWSKKEFAHVQYYESLPESDDKEKFGRLVLEEY